MTSASQYLIDWPSGLEPDAVPVFAHNQLRIEAPASTVWAWLVHAERWHDYYFNCRWLKFVGDRPPGGRLAPGVRFTWWTFGVPVDCTVTDYASERRLTWIGGGAGARGCHTWLIEPDGLGCQVVTEETQAGVIPRVAAPFLNRALPWAHQKWLESLARVVESGPPQATGD